MKSNSTILLHDRFEVWAELLAERPTPLKAVGKTPLSAVFAGSNPDNPEVLVKILDARKQYGQWWAFVGVASTYNARVQIKDTVDGRVYSLRANTDGGVQVIKDA